MWYKVKATVESQDGMHKNETYYFLCDRDNFAEAGYEVMKHLNGECEIEDVCLMKTMKPLANPQYSERNKVFIVKIAQDFITDDGKTKTMKYPIPFYASDNSQLQKIIDEYLKQGLEGMRPTSISETKWEIL